jgi:hypothetical protein
MRSGSGDFDAATLAAPSRAILAEDHRAITSL